MPSIKEFLPLAHSFHTASSWLLLLSTILPASNTPIFWFFPWPLGSNESFSACRQFPGILLGQKWARFVLVALCVQTLGLLFFLLTQSQESTLHAPPTHTPSLSLQHPAILVQEKPPGQPRPRGFQGLTCHTSTLGVKVCQCVN